jgi:hypothetical protein
MSKPYWPWSHDAWHRSLWDTGAEGTRNGFGRVRFLSPVKSEQRACGKFRLVSLTELAVPCNPPEKPCLKKAQLDANIALEVDHLA